MEYQYNNLQNQTDLNVPYNKLLEIKNGVINIMNGVNENQDKQRILYDLQTILNAITEIETKNSEENRDNKENIKYRGSPTKDDIKVKEYENGTYEGELKNDLRDGKGKMTWKDGDVYEGDWKNGKFDGFGKYYYNNGDRYEGEFKNDSCEGRGIYYYQSGDRYEGDFKNWKSEGKGVYYYNSGDSSGDKYDGEFKDDVSNGKGIYYFKSGDRYEGDFKDDKKDGKGIYYYRNGDREMGDYLNGKPCGKHIKICADGTVETINY